jgi:hypothetical protein
MSCPRAGWGPHVRFGVGSLSGAIDSRAGPRCVRWRRYRGAGRRSPANRVHPCEIRAGRPNFAGNGALERARGGILIHIRRKRPTIELCRTFLFPHTHGAFPPFHRPKAPRSPRPAPAPPANHLLRAPGPRRLRSRRSRAVPAARRAPKTLKTRAFSPAPRHWRATRSPATTTPIGALWRQRLALTNAAALARHAGSPKTRRRCDRPPPGAMPGLCAGQVTIPDPRGACCKLGGGSPNATRQTKRSACGQSGGCLDRWTSSKCLSMTRSRTSAPPPRRWP